MKAFKVLFNTTLFTISLTSTMSLFAQEYDNTANINFGAVDYFFDSERNQDDDIGIAVGAELPLAGRWSIAADYFDVDSDIEGAVGDSDLELFRVGFNYHFNKVAGWQPYAGFGLGKLDIDPNIISPNDVRETSVDLGIGVKRYLSDKWLFRTDYKMIFGDKTSAHDSALTVGFAYAFGRRSAPAARPVAAAPTPAPAVAERDSDGDGVVDSRDKCPDTPRNLAVDADGCPILDIDQRRQELLVNFDFDRSEVKPQYDAEIAEFAEFMQTYGNTNAVIEGHTDSVGTEEYNQGLSERRANAVRNELVNKHNIPAGRVSTIGYGESRPVDTNSTDAGRANNRRIEAVISVEIEEQRRR